MRRRTFPTLAALALVAAAAACAEQTPDDGAELGEAAVSAGPGATDIYLLTLAGEGDSLSIDGAPTRVTDRDGYDNQPFFTPAGDAILYTSIGDDGQADTWRYDIASGSRSQVTRTAESEYSPTPIPGADRFAVIQVEADSAQRLWSFAMDGTDPRLVLENVQPVGYQAWAGADQVAVFVLGDPPTLQLADTRTGEAALMAENIGRSLQKVPGRGAITFTQDSDGEWWIRQLEPATGAITPVAPLMGPDEYHVWTPGGTLLTGSGTSIYRWGDGAWDPVRDLEAAGLGQITRLAMSPDGDRLAVVVNR